MRMYEEFIRCPNCKWPYFERKEVVTLNKLAWEEEHIVEETRVLEYRCGSCEHLLKKLTLDAETY